MTQRKKSTFFKDEDFSVCYFNNKFTFTYNQHNSIYFEVKSYRNERKHLRWIYNEEFLLCRQNTPTILYM